MSSTTTPRTNSRSPTPLPYLVRSRLAMVQQLAALVQNGYYFWTSAKIPEEKNLEEVDQRILERYGCNVSKYTLYRRSKLGESKVRYLRCGRRIFLLATKGKSIFFEREKWRDCREAPVKYYGHSISFRDGHVSVRIHADTFKKLKRGLLHYAPLWSVEKWEEFWREGFPNRAQPWKPVRDQVFFLMREINRERKRHRLPVINWRTCYRRKRITLRVF